jgi:hypothetical protein
LLNVLIRVVANGETDTPDMCRITGLAMQGAVQAEVWLRYPAHIGFKQAFIV